MCLRMEIFDNRLNFAKFVSVANKFGIFTSCSLTPYERRMLKTELLLLEQLVNRDPKSVCVFDHYWFSDNRQVNCYYWTPILGLHCYHLYYCDFGLHRYHLYYCDFGLHCYHSWYYCYWLMGHWFLISLREFSQLEVDRLSLHYYYHDYNTVIKIVIGIVLLVSSTLKLPSISLFATTLGAARRWSCWTGCVPGDGPGCRRWPVTGAGSWSVSASGLRSMSRSTHGWSHPGCARDSGWISAVTWCSCVRRLRTVT